MHVYQDYLDIIIFGPEEFCIGAPKGGFKEPLNSLDVKHYEIMRIISSSCT